MKKILTSSLGLMLLLTACGGPSKETPDTSLTDELINAPDITIQGGDAPLDPTLEPSVTGPTTAPPRNDETNE